MSYFSDTSAGDADIRVVRHDELPALPLVDGIRVRPIIGDKLNIQEVTLDPGAVAPVHTHDEEQLGYIVSGSCDFTDGTSTWRLGPGDCYAALPGTPHGATAHGEGCVVIDAFSPPRAQVLQMLAKQERQ